MMYKHNLALAVKANGKVLREFEDKVYVPFGSEYSILLKNLNSVRAVVHITIDGQAVVQGGLVLPPNMKKPFELERFVSNLDKGNRFKFIERTSKVENHRGIKMDDGLITVEYEFEKHQPKIETEEIHHYKKHYYHDWHGYRGGPHWYGAGGGNLGSGLGGASYSDTFGQWSDTIGAAGSTGPSGSLGASGIQCSAGTPRAVAQNFLATSSVLRNLPVADSAIGITVKGSESKQSFTHSEYFALDGRKYSMTLHLLGETEGATVTKAVTVKAKKICTSCGHNNHPSANFCSECGTALSDSTAFA